MALSPSLHTVIIRTWNVETGIYARRPVVDSAKMFVHMILKRKSFYPVHALFLWLQGTCQSCGAGGPNLWACLQVRLGLKWGFFSFFLIDVLGFCLFKGKITVYLVYCVTRNPSNCKHNYCHTNYFI